MNGQTSLFYDSELQALTEAVRQLGGFKRVGPLVWPAKGDQAAQHLRDCLNPQRREVMHLHEVLHVLKLARQAGHHQPFAWICEELGYEPPRPRQPKDEMAELQRAYIESVQLQRQIAERMERLAEPPVRAVR